MLETTDCAREMIRTGKRGKEGVLSFCLFVFLFPVARALSCNGKDVFLACLVILLGAVCYEGRFWPGATAPRSVTDGAATKQPNKIVSVAVANKRWGFIAMQG